MKTQERVNQIKGSMTSFRQPTYSKEERLEELLKLQRETVSIAYSGMDEESVSRLRLWDALDHLKRENQSCGCKANAEIEAFERGCREIGRRIAAEFSGNRGEEKAYRRLQYKECPGTILRNLQLSDGDQRTEIDLVVINEGTAFVIEVKNTHMDVYIDEVGDQYRTGENEHFDTQLGTKMEFRKKLVTDIAERAGFPDIEVIGIVCYTDSRIRVYNHCESLTTCTLGKLPFLIKEHSSIIIDGSNGKSTLAEALLETSSQERYPMDYDIEGFKDDFAKAVVAVEKAKEKQGSFASRIENLFNSVFRASANGNTASTSFAAA